MAAIENLPACFYLGKEFDLDQRAVRPDVLQYESKQLTTHALCVGMTGSGKTGLCIDLIEEAALDGIPVLCIDPKGDLGNLLLTFPDLKPEDFAPWIDMAEVRAGASGDEGNKGDEDSLRSQAAERVAKIWSDGISQWGLDQGYLEKLAAVPKTIYTPGSSIGVPMTVLKSFHAPSESLRNSTESFREHIANAASGLLSLLGISADPLSSREHILISNLLAHAWERGHDLSMEDLIRQIQSPPMQKIGVLDLESFFPTSERSKLAMQLNNLLASPAFAGWLQGQSLSIPELLYDAKGRAKVSIVSIAHLNDAERMFFVTLLLNELVSWMRTQSGTGALRALFYMDEVYGYFPPSSKPPSKGPMMTLLKQARAFGLGIILATQNPVDLDYKGLSNMGTWFLGRLQTQRDKDRVLDGLEGASAQQGRSLDRKEMDRILSGLGKRVFVMNNVHENAPTLFQTRFALSYLRGPLSRPEISRLMETQRAAQTPRPSQAGERDIAPAAAKQEGRSVPQSTASRPILPAGILERFASPDRSPPPQSRLAYRSALMASVAIHFVRASQKVDYWKDATLVATLSNPIPEHPWQDALETKLDNWDWEERPEPNASFLDPPAEILAPKNYKSWERELASHLFRHEKAVIYTCSAIKRYTAPGLDEFSARLELAQAAREARDDAMAKVRDLFDTKLRSLEPKLLAAQQRVERLQEEAKAKQMDGLVSIGTSILGALLGGRRRSAGTNAAVRDLARAANKKGDIERAAESWQVLLDQRDDLERQCQREVDDVERRFSIENLELEAIEIPIRKSDLKIKQLALVWLPIALDAWGRETLLVSIEQTPRMSSHSSK